MGGPCDVDGQERQELDNFYHCRVELDGMTFPSSEHAYQASKFPDDPAMREAIRAASGGMESWQQGQTRSDRMRSDWEEVKVQKMYEANLYKYSHNELLRDLLVGSQGPIAARGGLFWKTWNEILLERIREELRPAAERDSAALALRREAMEAYRLAAAAGDKDLAQAVTIHASRRELVPERDANAVNAVTISGAADLDGTYDLDVIAPMVNGQPHFKRKGDVAHLYLGHKKGKRCWVLDEALDMNECSGTAFLEVNGDSALPTGARTWRLYRERGHVDAELSLSPK